MRIRELIEELKKFNPDMECIWEGLIDGTLEGVQHPLTKESIYVDTYYPDMEDEDDFEEVIFFSGKI